MKSKFSWQKGANKMTIAVLALQGAFLEHEEILHRLGISTIEIRQKKDLSQPFDGLIIPGGESTVQGKLLHDLDLYDELKRRIENGLPTFGTCAGMILLASNIENDDKKHLGTMHITVTRNAYGRQLGSFHTESMFHGIGKIPMTFIRAPYITQVSDDVTVLATIDGNIVAARQGNQLVTAFHPELDDATDVHEYFCKIIGG